jgi:hypothetical protein
VIILFFHAEVIQPPGGRRMIRAPAIMRQKYIVPSAMMRLATYAALPIFGASHDPNRERRLTFEGTTARRNCLGPWTLNPRWHQRIARSVRMKTARNRSGGIESKHCSYGNADHLLLL